MSDSSLGKAFIEIHADLKQFPAETKAKLKAALEESAAGMNTKPIEDKVGAAGKKAGEKFEKNLSQKFSEKANEFIKQGNQVGDKIMGGIMRSVFSMGSLLTLGISAAVLAVGQLIGPALGALAAVPAAIGVGVAALATLKMATHGVGDAIKAAFGDDQQKLNEAMKKLAPAAREVVAEFGSMRKQLHAMQQDIQQTFFVQLEGSIKRLMTTLLPTLRVGLHQVAADLGQMARGVVDVFSSPSGKQGIAEILLAAHKAIQPLIPAVRALVGAFITLGATGGPFVASLSAGFGKLLERFGDFIAKVSANGSLSAFFDVALTALQALGRIAGDVFSIIQSIFKAMTSSGTDIVGVIGMIVHQLALLFAGPQGQQLLIAIGAIVLSLGQVLIAIAPILPPLALLLAQLGVDLAHAITASIPLIERLVKLLSDLLTWMTDHKAAVEGFGIAVGALYGAFKIATAIDNATTSLKEFTTTMKGLSVVESVVGWLKSLKTATVAAAVATDALTASEVAADVAFYASPVGWVVLAVVALIAAIVLLIVYWDDVKKAGTQVWHAIEGAAKSVWNWLKGAASSVGDFFSGIGRWFEELPGKIGKWLSGLAKTIGDKVTSAGKAVLDWFESLPDKIGNFLASLPRRIGDALLAALHFAGEVVGVAIGLIIGSIIFTFTRLPGMLWDALKWLGKVIGDAFSDAWDWTVKVVVKGFDATVDWFTKLPGRIWDALKSLAKTIGKAFSDAWDWTVKVVSDGFDATLDFFVKLPGRIGSWLEKLPKIIGDAFTSAWKWAKDETSKAADWILDFAKKLPGRLGNFLGNVGHDIVAGLKAGINSVISGFNSGIDKAGALLHMSMPHIPMLAKGAIVDSPTLAVVGERGREVVMPLNDPARAQQLAAQSGLLGILKQPSSAPLINFTAILGTGQILEVVKTVVEQVIDGQRQQLASGVRAA